MSDDLSMRTTLDLDADALQAAKEIAILRGITAGKAVSDLIRKALEPAAGSGARIRNGVPVMPRQTAGTPKMTMALVNELRDEP
jgi:hypothetical protein